ncbi:MAG: hypothetical protein M0C28_46680 [Candidatus Moduliflexus flocculans]|nr:hypothetical protein [Candidatus Moduliflexus flocculans]
MQLQRLTGLERQKIDGRAGRGARDASSGCAPSSPATRLLMRDRRSTSCARSASSTATRAAPRSSTRSGEFRIEDLIADEDMAITVTHTGYIKRTAVAELPRRSGAAARAASGCGSEEEDFVDAPLRRLDARLHPDLHRPRAGSTG